MATVSGAGVRENSHFLIYLGNVDEKPLDEIEFSLSRTKKSHDGLKALCYEKSRHGAMMSNINPRWEDA